MNHAVHLRTLLVVVALEAACQPLRYPVDDPDAGARDASVGDVGRDDAGPQDAGRPDSGARDAGFMRDAGATRDGGALSDAGPRDGGPPVFHTLSVTTSGAGVGRVISSPAGIDCPGTCEAEFAEGAEIHLDAVPTRTSRVGGWSLPCGRMETCAATLVAGISVDVFFEIRPRVFVGDEHSCAVDPAGRLRCWGRNNEGQLGYDDTTNVGDGMGPSVQDAGFVNAGAGVIVDASLGRFHTCALFADGRLKCWGYGSRGALGHNSAENIGDSETRRVSFAGDVPVGGLVAEVRAFDEMTCALLTTGAVRCWGTNFFGGLGHGSTSSVGNGTGPSIIAAGNLALSGAARSITHRCALLSAGGVECWDGGVDRSGDTIFRSVNVGEPVLELVSGNRHHCALLAAGRVRCWGANDYGALGYNNMVNVDDGVGPSIPVAGDVPVGAPVAQIVVGGAYTCAVLSSGGLRCWGYGADGRLGYGNTDNIGDGMGLDVAMAGVVALAGSATRIALSQLSGRHTCAATDMDEVYCWGNGGSGRLGYGATTNIGDGVGLSVANAGPMLSF